MTENRDTMTTSGAAGDAALAVWLTMWNSDGEIARRICTDDFRIHFLNSEADGSNPGDDVVGADQFAEYLDAYRQRHPDVVFTEVARATDGLHGRLLWDVRADGNAAGGVDVFDVTEDVCTGRPPAGIAPTHLCGTSRRRVRGVEADDRARHPDRCNSPVSRSTPITVSQGDIRSFESIPCRR